MLDSAAYATPENSYFEMHVDTYAPADASFMEHAPRYWGEDYGDGWWQTGAGWYYVALRWQPAANSGFTVYGMHYDEEPADVGERCSIFAYQIMRPNPQDWSDLRHGIPQTNLLANGQINWANETEKTAGGGFLNGNNGNAVLSHWNTIYRPENFGNHVFAGDYVFVIVTESPPAAAGTFFIYTDATVQTPPNPDNPPPEELPGVEPAPPDYPNPPGYDPGLGPPIEYFPDPDPGARVPMSGPGSAMLIDLVRQFSGAVHQPVRLTGPTNIAMVKTNVTDLPSGWTASEAADIYHSSSTTVRVGAETLYAERGDVIRDASAQLVADDVRILRSGWQCPGYLPVLDLGSAPAARWRYSFTPDGFRANIDFMFPLAPHARR